MKTIVNPSNKIIVPPKHLANPFGRRHFANSIDAFIPEVWAMESLAILEETMVMANLVHRDFQDEVAAYGDIVHTRKPGEFTAKRKTPSDNVTVQNATATDVQVPLNQHIHVSFIIRDEENSKSFQDLVTTYLRPAILAQMRLVDQCISGQVYRFLGNYAGGLGLMTSTTSKDYLLDTREVLNQNKVPMDGRNLVVGTNTETELLKTDLFVSAERVGDQGTALREASLGRKFGFDVFMAQNQPSYTYRDTGSTTVNDATFVAGDTTFDAASSHGIVAGCYLKIAGDARPQLVTSISTNTITIYPGVATDIANGAAITRYMPGAVNQASTAEADSGAAGSSGYAAGWAKEIICNAFDATNAPKVGQLITFGGTTTMTGTNPVYAITQVNSLGTTNYSFLLDRPLDAAIVNSALVAVGPSGDYNFAFHRNALALVCRPLAMPRQGVGAIAGTAVGNNISMRVVITYNGDKQGHLVTVDCLLGVAVLDTALGAVLLG